METTIGKLLLKHNVPEHLKSYVNETPLDKKGIAGLFSKLSDTGSDSYRDHVSNLARLGFEVSTRQGSTVPLNDLTPLDDKNQRFDELEKKLKEIDKGPGSKIDKDQKKGLLYEEFTKDFDKALMAAGKEKNHTLSKVITSGSRGSAAQYRQTAGAVVLVSDEKGRPIMDYPIRHSFAEGLTIPEYLLHSYGTRAGAIGTKLCCSGDTKVLLPNGQNKSIKDIKVGEFVMGADTKGNITPVKVTNFFENGEKQCYTYKFRKLQSHTEFVTLTCTEDHKLLAQIKDGRDNPRSIYTPTPMPAKKLQKRIGIAYPAQGGLFAEGLDETRALLLGLLLGDGCTTQLDRGNMYFSCADQSLLDEVRDYLADHNYQLVKCRTKEQDYSYRFNYISKPEKIIKDDSVNEFGLPKVYSGDACKAWLKEIGLEGTYAHEKTLPDNIWEWNNTSIANLIGGLFSCDGSIFRSKVGQVSLRLSLTAKEMLEQVKRLLEVRFGIFANLIVKTDKEKKVFAKNDIYHLTISHAVCVKRFHEQIPLVGKKRQRLKDYIKNLKIKPHNSELTYGYQGKEDAGIIPTYDIEVDHPDHLFCTADLLIISNSIADSGYASKQLARAAMPIKVEEHDCGTDNGIPVAVTDRDSIGAFLAKPAGGYNKNNEVTAAMLADLRSKGKINSILIRSPITCQSSRKHHFGAVCQLCAGRREKGTLPEIDSYLGLAAASALGEPLCATGDNLVLMSDLSHKRLDEIQIGDEVIGVALDGTKRPVKVTNVFSQGEKDCFEYFFKKGFTAKSDDISIRCTPDHRILGMLVNRHDESRYPAANVFAAGTKTASKKYVKIGGIFDDSGKKDEPFALICGLLTGDGNYTEVAKKAGVGFSCHDPLLIDQITSYVFDIGLRIKPTVTPNEFKIRQIGEVESFTTCENGEQVRSPIRAFLVNEEIWGQYSYQKTLPKNIHNWSNKSVAAFLSGLIATDGWISKLKQGVTVGFSSTSKSLVEGIKLLLEFRFGIITSNICEKKKKKEDGSYYRTSYEINVCHADYIRQLGGILNIPGIKQERLKTAIQNINTDKAREAGRFNLVRTKHLGLLPTYDIEVDHPDHLYLLANGIVTHNSQGTLNSKHSGSGASLGKTVATGFKLIQQLVNVPHTFQGKAAIAVHDGLVSDIHKLPQGGFDITVNTGNKQVGHYVPSGFDPLVKVGDRVEQGDVLSDGIVNPAEIVKYKGVGEGRKYYADTLHRVFDESGMGGSHRNFQVIAKAAIDHVKITHPDGLGEHLPDSVVSYQTIEKDYHPRSDSKELRIDLARGKFLEKPALHFTIGTRLTSRMIEQLKEHGIESVTVNDLPPPFEAEMHRLLDVPGHVPDIFHQLYSTYLEKRLIKGVNEGLTSNLKGPSPILGLAYGAKFGLKTAEEEI